MEMKNGLPGIGPAIGHQPIPALGHPKLRGELLADQGDVSHQFLVSRPESIQAGDVLLGYDQHVHWHLRRNVLEGNHEIILVNDGGRNLLGGYFAKKAGWILHVGPL